MTHTTKVTQYFKEGEHEALCTWASGLPVRMAQWPDAIRSIVLVRCAGFVLVGANEGTSGYATAEEYFKYPTTEGEWVKEFTVETTDTYCGHQLDTKEFESPVDPTTEGEWVKEITVETDMEQSEGHWMPQGTIERLKAAAERMSDPINPTHYKDQYPIEVIEMIRAVFVAIYGEDKADFAMEAYCLGNELKYRLRSGFKDADTIVQDIEKSMWYNKTRRGEE